MALAPPISNVGTQGQDARYDISGLPQVRPGVYSDGVYEYDSNGLSLNRPNTFVPGLPGANDNGPGGPGAGQSAPGDVAGLFNNAVSSPFYQQALAATQAAGAADAAARRAAIQQVLIQFGLVPDNFQDKYGDIDATTRSLAQQNTQSGISAVARLKQALSDAQRNSSRSLAARGLRRSGARGYQMRRNQLGYDQSYSDALNSLLSGINQTYQGFAQGEYGRSMSLAQALQNAIGNMSFSYRPSGGGGGASFSSQPAAPAPFDYYNYSPGAPGTPTLGGGTVGDGSPEFRLGGGSGTSSKKPILY